MPCIESDTFDDQDRPRILQFTGFVYKYRAGEGSQPTLTWYTQLPWVMDFVAFLVDVREASSAFARSHICTAIYVLDFLKHAKASASERPVVEDMIQALERLGKQVG